MHARHRERLQLAMSALAEGDRSAFHPVFAALWPLLQRFCERVLHDPASAQDAAQGALMKLFLHAGDFRPASDPVAWALGFASFECRSLRNRMVRRRELNDDGLLSTIPAYGASPEETAIDEDLRAAAFELMGSLRPGDVETLHLAFAGVRPTSSGVVFRKRLQRALARLRTAWRYTHGSHD